MHNIYKPVVLKERIHDCVLTDQNINIFFYKQVVCERGTKMKKKCCMHNFRTSLYRFETGLETTFLLSKEQPIYRSLSGSTSPG